MLGKINLVFDQWVNERPLPNGSFLINEYNLLSLPHTILHFYNIKNYVNHNLSSVNKNPGIKFYYIIKYNINILMKFKQLGNLLLSDNLIETLKTCPNLSIIYLCDHEPEGETFFTYLSKEIDRLGLNHKQFVVANNNSKIGDYKTDVRTHNLKFLTKFYSKIFNPYRKIPFTTEKNGKFMMCHNKIPKPHRYGLMVLLKKYELLDQIDWSLVMGVEHKKINSMNNYQNFYYNIFSTEEINEYRSQIDYINSIDTKKSDYERDKIWFDSEENMRNVFNSHSIEPNQLINTYVNCITESVYNENTIHITEKTIKPFYFYQIPIFLASEGHVEFLRNEYGFDLYDDLINHDYDRITDNKERLKVFVKEIIRILDNKKNIVDFYNNNRDRFEKNKQIVTDLTKDKKDIEFFNSLITNSVS
jgi:hypothetical protein